MLFSYVITRRPGLYEHKQMSTIIMHNVPINMLFKSSSLGDKCVVRVFIFSFDYFSRSPRRVASYGVASTTIVEVNGCSEWSVVQHVCLSVCPVFLLSCFDYFF